ncbi:MAG: hypothetical protein K2G26_05955, partial [Clostridia bacterium]|nr:hypothetical protein [Clostridia bacterium]
MGETTSTSHIPNVRISFGEKGSASSSSGSHTVTFENNDSNDLDKTIYFSAYATSFTGKSHYISFNFSLTTTITETNINVPQNITATYDTYNHWLDSFADAWIENFHTDESAVVVNSINYVPPTGSTTGQAKDLGTDTDSIIEAGTYTVSVGLPDDAVCRWSDETLADKTFTITINRATPAVTVNNPYSGATYLPDELPELTNSASNATAGTLSWRTQQPMV